MNDKEQLLADTFDANEGIQFSRHAAAYARRRRTMRRTSITVGLVVSVIACFFTIHRSSPPPPMINAATPVLEIITDQELMAQFEGQPVVYVKDTTGITQVIILAQN